MVNDNKANSISSKDTPRNRIILILAEMIKKYGDNVLAKLENKQSK